MASNSLAAAQCSVRECENWANYGFVEIRQQHKIYYVCLFLKTFHPGFELNFNPVFFC